MTFQCRSLAARKWHLLRRGGRGGSGDENFKKNTIWKRRNLILIVELMFGLRTQPGITHVCNWAEPGRTVLQQADVLSFFPSFFFLKKYIPVRCTCWRKTFRLGLEKEFLRLFSFADAAPWRTGSRRTGSRKQEQEAGSRTQASPEQLYFRAARRCFPVDLDRHLITRDHMLVKSLQFFLSYCTASLSPSSPFMLIALLVAVIDLNYLSRRVTQMTSR